MSAAQTSGRLRPAPGVLLLSLMVVRLYLPPFRLAGAYPERGRRAPPRRLLRWSFWRSFHQAYICTQPDRTQRNAFPT
jgi:hypothetical protein